MSSSSKRTKISESLIESRSIFRIFRNNNLNSSRSISPLWSLSNSRNNLCQLASFPVPTPPTYDAAFQRCRIFFKVSSVMLQVLDSIRSLAMRSTRCFWSSRTDRSTDESAKIRRLRPDETSLPCTAFLKSASRSLPCLLTLPPPLICITITSTASDISRFSKLYPLLVSTSPTFGQLGVTLPHGRSFTLGPHFIIPGSLTVFGGNLPHFISIGLAPLCGAVLMRDSLRLGPALSFSSLIT